VLGGNDGLSSLAASVSTAAEVLDGRIDATTANMVRWGTHSALVATVSHFLELKTEVEVFGSGCNADLSEDEVDAFWTWVRATVDLLVSYVPSSVAHNPPGGAGE
jgi:hypothetical protein